MRPRDGPWPHGNKPIGLCHERVRSAVHKASHSGFLARTLERHGRVHVSNVNHEYMKAKLKWTTKRIVIAVGNPECERKIKVHFKRADAGRTGAGLSEGTPFDPEMTHCGDDKY
jgi:hypothetical protein